MKDRLIEYIQSRIKYIQNKLSSCRGYSPVEKNARIDELKNMVNVVLAIYFAKIKEEKSECIRKKIESYSETLDSQNYTKLYPGSTKDIKRELEELKLELERLNNDR